MTNNAIFLFVLVLMVFELHIQADAQYEKADSKLRMFEYI